MSTTNQQITTQSQGLGPVGSQIEGMEGLSESDFAIPRWSLIQPTSQKEGADAHNGQFKRNLDGAFAESLDVVILKVSPNRLLWSGDRSDTRPECFSRDAVTGSVYGTCASCMFNTTFNRELVAERKENPQAKACNYGYSMVCGTADGEEKGALALIGAMGTSVRPIKTLNTTFSTKGRPPFSAVTRFDAERVVNDRGKFYVLKPTIARWMDPAETAEWRQRYLAIKGATIKDIDEDVAEDVDAAEAEADLGNSRF